MSINIKLINGTQKSAEVPDLGITVSALKEITAPVVEIPADEQRIVLRGKVLKDGDVLSSVGLEHGNTIHVVRSKKKDAPAVETPAPSTQSPSAVPSSTVAPQATAAQPASNPYAALFGNNAAPNSGNPFGAVPPMGGGPAGQGFSPELMMQMMQNPMVQQMAAESMRNPQNNPMLANMPPEVLQQSLQMMSNPEVMSQMMAMLGSMNGAPQPNAQGQPAFPSPSATNAFFAPPPPQGNPREIYRDQLQQLREMGFPNEDANIAALQQSQGNVSFAIERLFNA